jgi:hypothetical protein
MKYVLHIRTMLFVQKSLVHNGWLFGQKAHNSKCFYSWKARAGGFCKLLLLRF